VDPTSLAVAPYTSSTFGGAIGFGVPISETDTINVAFRAEHTDLTLFTDSPLIYYQFVNTFGYATNSYILVGGWSRDTRDDILYPTRGVLQSALAEVGLPFGDLSYYKVNYLIQAFWPVYGDFVWMLRGDAGYADGYGGKPLPFFKALFAGGVGSVRGYGTASLGPRQLTVVPFDPPPGATVAIGNAIGGKQKIVGNTELFYPILKGDKSVRGSVFFDAGQVSGLIYDLAIPELDKKYSDFQQQFESFRYSAGVGLAWNSPIGPLKFSYAIPLNKKPGDEIQRFQFQVGTVF
jgi:outer membrane protein insertion porin family